MSSSGDEDGQLPGQTACTAPQTLPRRCDYEAGAGGTRWRPPLAAACLGRQHRQRSSSRCLVSAWAPSGGFRSGCPALGLPGQLARARGCHPTAPGPHTRRPKAGRRASSARPWKPLPRLFCWLVLPPPGKSNSDVVRCAMSLAQTAGQTRTVT